MTDLTLDEYRGISQRELGQKLQAEARMMFNPESLEKDMEKVATDIYPVTQHKHKWTALISRYWLKKKLKNGISIIEQLKMSFGLLEKAQKNVLKSLD